MTVVHAGLVAWIIQDGNYGDFEADAAYRFALEFHPQDLAPRDAVSSEAPFLTHTAGAIHQARGTIVRSTRSSWVIGVLAFQEARPPRWATPGKSASGHVYIGILRPLLGWSRANTAGR